MGLKKYLKCFTKEKSEELKSNGYSFLYEQNGVFYFEDNDSLTVKFSKNDLLNGVKKANFINL